MPDELRLFRTLAVIVAAWLLVCIVFARIARGAQPSIYTLYVPVVIRPSCAPQSWKGLAGFEDTAAGSLAMCAMHVGSVYQWQQVYAHPYLSAYPLPSQPVDMVKSNASQVAFVGFNGIVCNGDRLQCVADALSDAGPVYMMIFNEPDNSNPCCGDGLTPDLMAQRFKVISDSLLTANPQLKLVVGNYELPNAVYHQQFIAAYLSLYGVDPSNAIYSIGYHAYGDIGWQGDVMLNFAAALANAKAQNGSKPIWISEWGANASGTQSSAYDASYIAQMCAALIAANVERAFLYIGNRAQPNASVLGADGGLSAVGLAYKDC